MASSLIEKFLRGECNDEEQALVKEYLSLHPEALQPYLTEESWQSFCTTQQLPAETSGKMLSVIAQQTYQRPSSGRRFIAWAAALLLLVSGGAWWIVAHRRPVTVIASKVPAPVAAHDSVSMKEIVNQGHSVLQITLKDGSKAELTPGSRIRYSEPFSPTNRDIYLNGEALFRVAPDKARPFTVYAGTLGTTALGTVFRVIAWDDKKTARVQLLSGKVVVKSVNSRTREIYLLPGQTLDYDRRKMTAHVNTISRTPVPAAVPMATLSFRNEPLTNIFRQLGEQYHVKIQYPEKALEGMNFTGAFDGNKESLNDFLNTIGILNGLTIKQKDHVIYIAP